MNLLEKFKKITTFIFDVDGVFTNNHILVTEDGQLLRSMNTRDGLAVKKAIEMGYNIAIITGGNSKGVNIRFNNLGINHIYSGVNNKKEAFYDLIELLGIQPDEILYMGDDILDVPVMRLVELPTCPNDAIPEVHEISTYISPLKGGDGCVRDVIEKVLKLQNKWFA
ncbi:MAG: HAD hydrolase family protein [Saprospiraceae bacterium]|nr:HAD hydrolase family protein [Saprospiraceae bacterium]